MEREDLHAQLVRKDAQLLAAQKTNSEHSDVMDVMTYKCEALQWELVKFTGELTTALPALLWCAPSATMVCSLVCSLACSWCAHLVCSQCNY
jgi:hypothetical protein